MHHKLIDGKAIAAEVVSAVFNKVSSHVEKGHRAPKLSVILVGHDPASEIYVANKKKSCEKAGINSDVYKLPDHTTEKQLLRKITELNEDDTVDGILLQLPLPSHLDPYKAITRIAPAKDVDGLTPWQQGAIQWRQPGLYSCTALAVLKILKSVTSLEGKIAAVIGHGILVGAPTTSLLIKEDVTPLVIHKNTPNPSSLAKLADIVVVATGVRHLVNEQWIKDGAIVVDGGVHRYENKLWGDVDFNAVYSKVSYITPVPGGVGPLTVAMLVHNCWQIFEEKIAP